MHSWLCTISTQTPSQQSWVHAIRNFRRCTWNGSTKTTLCRATSNWWISEESRSKLMHKLSGVKFRLFFNSRLTYASCLFFSLTFFVHWITFPVWSSKLNQIQLTSSSHIGITSVFVWGKFDVVVIVTDTKISLKKLNAN